MFRKSTFIIFISVISIAALAGPSLSETPSRPVRLLNIQPVQTGPSQRVYFYSESDSPETLLSFRKELIAKGYRHVNCFYPSLVVCEVPAEESAQELTLLTDIVPVLETEISTASFRGPANELRRVKQCYSRFEENKSALFQRARETQMPEADMHSYLEHDDLLLPDPVPQEPSDSYNNIQQNSEFLIGDILIQMIYPESSGPDENWSDQGLSAAAQGAHMAILSWQDNYRNVPIHVIFNGYPRAYTALEPITFTRANQGYWIKDVMNNLGYTNNTLSASALVHLFNNDGREQFQTDWVFTAFIVNSTNDLDHNFPKEGRRSGWGFLGGPYLVLSFPEGFNYQTNMSWLFKHFMGKIFWATHEEKGGGSTCDSRSGYLNYRNYNKIIEEDPIGGPVSCGERRPYACTMNYLDASYGYTDEPCRFSAGMLGLADENSNYVPDALDAAPIIEFAVARRETIWTGSYDLNFRAVSQGVPNQNPLQGAASRIDYALPVKDVSYKVNGIGPIILMPEDGLSDEFIEDFVAFLPDLIPGTTEISVTTRNTLGSTSAAYKKYLFYMGLSYQHFNFNYSNQGIGITWNMLGETFDASFDLHRIVDGPVPVDSIIVADVPYVPSGDYFTRFSCFDNDVTPGQEYTYYVEGSFSVLYRGVLKTVTSRSNDFNIIASLHIADNYLFSPPSPNPFREQTWISIDIPASYRDAGDPNLSATTHPGSRAPAASIQDPIPTHTSVVIYDVLGRLVKNLYKDRIYSTVLTIPWDGTNNSNERLPSGIYFMKVDTGPYSQIQKVMILR